MKTVFITGSNRGIGLEFTKQYLNEGYLVLACCRKPDEATDLKALQNSFPETLKIHPLDIRDHSAIEDLSKKIKSQPIDILISNAGVYGSQRNHFGNIDYQNWLETFQVNTLATTKLAEVFLDNLLLGTEKKFIAITSKMGSLTDNTSGGSYIYRSSKAALNMVIKSLSYDLSHHQIKVAALHPGWVLTDMGGQNALITPQESVIGLRKVIKNLQFSQEKLFFDYKGTLIAW